MSLGEIAALVRRHVVAVMVVFILTVGLAYEIKRTPPVYTESATVVFMSPKSLAFPDPYSAFNSGLVPTAEVMMRTMLSPQSRRTVREAGGTASFNLALVNFYNEEYPNYGVPYLTLTTTSVNPSEVHRTFTVVVSALNQLVAARQAQESVQERNRISTKIVADTGPLVEPGSPKRTFAGLAVLAIVAAFLVSIFLDRHPARLGAIFRSPPSERPGPPAGERDAPSRPGVRR